MDLFSQLADLLAKWTGSYADLVFSLIGVAAAMAALLPAPKEGQTAYRIFHAAVNFLAMNILRARNAGTRK